ncbi:hypothetical protein [Algoriphagus sp.]|uniref:hypothetical protein n=1 Tax=Algoriphagus sp. TaxID=1872435 RepID=UPI0025CDCB1F|nr:hypothetical protein [Algoriphagus sp.]
MKKRKSMLDYCKTILKAVSFDRKLFKKEYRKALKWLSNDEGRELKYWLRQEYIRSNISIRKKQEERYLTNLSI